MRRSTFVKISALFLLTSLLLSSCSTGGGRENGGEQTTEVTPAYAIQSWITPSVDKQIANADIPEEKDRATSIELLMVKNESESVQLSFYSNDRVDGFTVSAEGDTDGIEIQYFLEETVTVKGERWPDALVPLDGEFFLPRRLTRTVMVRFVTESTTAAGERRITLSLKNGGKVVSSFDVALTVYDITLDETPAMESFVLIYKNAIAQHHGYGKDLDKLSATQKEEVDALYKKYYDLLLDYGISGGTLPYDILDDRADAYMSDPRVTSFQVDQWVSDETLVAIYNKLKTNPEWLKKAVIYAMDEPNITEHYSDLVGRIERLDRVCPGISRLVTFYNDIWLDGGIDAVQYIMNNTDITVPSFACFNPGFLYKDQTLANTQRPLKDRIAEYKTNGENRCWSYVGWEPGKPYNNLYVNEKGIDHRVLYWQMFDHGVDGFLYWAANYWIDTGDPWVNQLTVPWLSMNVYGDGSLLYNGNKVGIDGACASLRLDLIRDGMEDYALLERAMELLGEKKTNSIIDKVTQGVITSTGSSEVFYKARASLIKELDKALNGK